ncbi:perlucin-like protein isoform X2 [Mytilus edulis]|uniref:perlucin-like protein isoform X2 n=1 Tax=Mytilus edulis TaxID=6550 RepID=UPI0039F0075F
MISFISVLILVCVSYVLASSSCISLAALKEYEAAREPLQNIEKFLGKCYGSYSTKEPIVTMRRSIEQLEKQFKEVNKMFYERKWSAEQKHNGHCYIFSKDKLTWPGAKKRCMEIGGYLVKIDNAKENSWLFGRANKKGLYAEDPYKWIWAHEKNHADFIQFTKGWPVLTNNSPKCVGFYSNELGWRNADCRQQHKYICETDKCV